MTWCNDALEHFLQKDVYQFPDVGFHFYLKRKQLAMKSGDILYDAKSPGEINNMNGCIFSLYLCEKVNDFYCTLCALTQTQAEILTHPMTSS